MQFSKSILWSAEPCYKFSWITNSPVFMQLSQQSQSELDIAESLGAILRVKQPYMGSEAQSSYACSKPSTSTMTFAVEPYMNFSRSSCHVASEIASLLPSLQSIPSSSMNLPTSCFATSPRCLRGYSPTGAVLRCAFSLYRSEMALTSMNPHGVPVSLCCNSSFT